MDLGKTKVPFRDDVRYFLDLPEGQRKKSCKYKFVWIVCFALTLGQAIFLTSTFVKVQNLEFQIKELRVQLDVLKNQNDYDSYSDDSEENNNGKVFLVNTDDSEEYDDYLDDTASEALNIDQFMLKQDATHTKTSENFRPKRSVVSATRDGVLVNSESYAETKRQNDTVHRGLHGVSITTLPARPSSFGDSPVWMTSRHYQTRASTVSSRPSPPPVFTRQSRVMHRDDKTKAFRQVVKKSSLKAGDLHDSSEQSYTDPGFTIVSDENLPKRRRTRPRGHLESFDEHPRLGRIKPLPTVHYSGDTSRYILGHHDNYKGNGRLMHLQHKYIDWKPNPWVHTLGMDQHFELENGVVTIKETGLYFIYAQVYYWDDHDRNEYQVWKNDVVLLQCATSTHTQRRETKANTCYTAGAEHLLQGDKISLKDFSTERYSIFEAGKSFFGLIKLGDIRIK